jgi:hypothetical protein
VNSDQRLARITGVLFLITYITAIGALAGQPDNPPQTASKLNFDPATPRRPSPQDAYLCGKEA